MNCQHGMLPECCFQCLNFQLGAVLSERAIVRQRVERAIAGYLTSIAIAHDDEELNGLGSEAHGYVRCALNCGQISQDEQCAWTDKIEQAVEDRSKELEDDDPIFSDDDYDDDDDDYDDTDE